MSNQTGYNALASVWSQRSLSAIPARTKRSQKRFVGSASPLREQLNQKVQKSAGNAQLLSELAVVDALLNSKEIAIAEARHAVELLPASRDALRGPFLDLNLAVVYAWTNELDQAFKKLSSLTQVPNGIFYGQLKRDAYWEPLHQDPRYQKLLAELAPRD
jgi:hypothetical protein